MLTAAFFFGRASRRGGALYATPEAPRGEILILGGNPALGGLLTLVTSDGRIPGAGVGRSVGIAARPIEIDADDIMLEFLMIGER